MLTAVTSYRQMGLVSFQYHLAQLLLNIALLAHLQMSVLHVWLLFRLEKQKFAINACLDMNLKTKHAPKCMGLAVPTIIQTQ